jgi:hypothetical protein
MSDEQVKNKDLNSKETKDAADGSKSAFKKPKLKVIDVEVEDSVLEAYAAGTCTKY